MEGGECSWENLHRVLGELGPGYGNGAETAEFCTLKIPRPGVPGGKI